MQIRTDSLVIEVTRRCNMCCAHCLRGEAQNLDITHEILEEIAKSITPCEVTFTGGEPTLNIGAIRDYFALAKKYGTLPSSFYVVTNGETSAELQKELALTLLEAYPDMDDPDMCGVAVSRDMYHGFTGKDNAAILRGLSFYRLEDKFVSAKMSGWIIDTGRASKNGIGERSSPPISESLEDIFEDRITANGAECEMLYVAANGNVIDNCDNSYEDIDAEALCHISELERRVETIAKSMLTTEIA